MKTLQRLKLTQLSSSELKEREMGMLKGGTEIRECCGCANGTDNLKANSSHGYGISNGNYELTCFGWSWTGTGWEEVMKGHCY